MRNPQNDTPDGQVGKSGAHVPERTCVLTRRKGTRDSLIRLALGPDGEVGPDVRARAPGRGAWISVGRAETTNQRTEDKGGVLADYGLSEEQGNEIIMAARAHWFEDEAPAGEDAVAETPE